MKNKTNFLGIIFAAMILASAFPAFAQISSSPEISVTMINQEPDPVSPGNPVITRFRIENVGNANAQNVQLQLIPKSPISFYNDDDVKTIGTLTAGQDGQLGVRQEWRLFVEPTAAVGENALEVWYRVSNGPWIKGGDFAITVRATSAVLAINEIRTTPESMVPGTLTNVSFVIENQAGAPLTDVRLNLGILNAVTNGATSTVVELPFTPVDSGNAKSLARIPAGESQEITFKLFTDATAQSRAYKVPYTISYKDVSGTEYNITGVVGLMVDSQPEVSVSIDETEIYQAGATGRISVKVVNKGFSDLKFMNVQLPEAESYDITSNNNIYIGKLDSDDYETADFSLIVSEDAQDNVTLPIHVEYRDANGQLYKQDYPLTLNLYSGSQLKQRTAGGGSGLVWFIAIAVALVAGIFLFRRFRKTRK